MLTRFCVDNVCQMAGGKVRLLDNLDISASSVRSDYKKLLRRRQQIRSGISSKDADIFVSMQYSKQ